jgi:hypothetical protein
MPCQTTTDHWQCAVVPDEGRESFSVASSIDWNTVERKKGSLAASFFAAYVGMSPG